MSRMGYLVDSTLDVARFESGTVSYRPGPVDPAALLTRVCQQQQELAPHHRIACRFEALPSSMSGDAGLLEQVFANLLSNAVKYSPDADEIEVHAFADATRLVVRVCDHGVGIPAQEMPRLFEKFFRASTAVGIPGTGIGLNITRQIVDLHGGILTVDSHVGTGTTFTVKLPLPSAA
ncbi:MAG: HAMP domain-containing histidine kinase [Lysobacterales bacterium]|nr:MAG: HAMP domain-containing histidine kinase [Xanthomonadales bacterium]